MKLRGFLRVVLLVSLALSYKDIANWLAAQLSGPLGKFYPSLAGHLAEMIWHARFQNCGLVYVPFEQGRSVACTSSLPVRDHAHTPEYSGAPNALCAEPMCLREAEVRVPSRLHVVRGAARSRPTCAAAWKARRQTAAMGGDEGPLSGHLRGDPVLWFHLLAV